MSMTSHALARSLPAASTRASTFSASSGARSAKARGPPFGHSAFQMLLPSLMWYSRQAAAKSLNPTFPVPCLSRSSRQARSAVRRRRRSAVTSWLTASFSEARGACLLLYSFRSTKSMCSCRRVLPRASASGDLCDTTASKTTPASPRKPRFETMALKSTLRMPIFTGQPSTKHSCFTWSLKALNMWSQWGAAHSRKASAAGSADAADRGLPAASAAGSASGASLQKPLSSSWGCHSVTLTGTAPQPAS
mmetsp:Transcript_105130/g.277701  ORF Transcript_105130/g.277701 Transcript_105130/m.277701 type:complete len:249 (-) Transcript_105130:8-754(-)